MRIPRIPQQVTLIATLLLSLVGMVVGGMACGSAAPTSTSPTSPAANSSGAPATSSTTAAGGAAIPAVTVNAREYAYDAPDTISAGLTRIRMQNAGKEDHQAQLLKSRMA